ncbi:hypothetical protein [Chryseobacterium sp.]|uniref:hypothetical protein n=1 Tax=Chryseobacterium sp. TaxID=1871047 RepID=UPI003890A9FB
MISAVFIPILFWYYGNQKYEEINFSYVEISIDPIFYKKTDFNTFESPINLNLKKIAVKPHEARKNSKFYISEIKKLQREYKKESGIEFILNDKNFYDDFVSLLNDMQLSKQENYILELEKTGHLFAFNSQEEDHIQFNDCGFGWSPTIYFLQSNYYGGFSTFVYLVSQLPKEAFYLIFGFLILLNISMLSIKESLQK